MWSFITGLFGNSKVVETAADVVKAGVGMVDNAFYTDQEKAANSIKITDVWLKLQMLWANDNSVSAVTRRLIAFMSYGTFFFLLIFVCMIWKYDKEWATFIIKTIIDLQLAWIVVTITIAFFGFYGYGKYVSKDNVPYSTESIDKK
jgi:hypothetical protein